MRFRYTEIDSFFHEASALRRVLDKRLGDRTSPFDKGRFAWEYWHVDAQFSQLRTPARDFFPDALMAAFEARLLGWASANLGVCRLGGPPWLSVIIDGGFQGLHRDSPNGQIAFSYGLGRNGRFRGGETLLASDDLLDYFRAGAHRDEAAHHPLFDEVVPRFNRIVLFDARLPHAVRAVQGSRSPREGRIAIQGWLEAAGCIARPKPPRPHDGSRGSYEGAPEATRAIKLALRAAKLRRELEGAEGLFTAKITLGRNGRARAIEPVASTLVRTGDLRDQPARAARALVRMLGRARFEGGVSPVVAPILVAEGGRAHVAGGK
jgi:hypothetical protein